MRLYRYCCGCIGFKHENERKNPDSRTVIGEALLVRTCEEGEYCLHVRTVDVSRHYADGRTWEQDGTTRELSEEETKHHLAMLSGYISMGYTLESVRNLLGIRT